jgi:hypothetical protein
MSSKRFLYLCLVLAILLAGVVTPLFQPSAAVAAPPNQPVNSSPANGAPDQSLTPTLQSSLFSDNVGDTQAASQWQITTILGNYTSPVFNGETNDNSTSIAIPLGPLNYSTT